MMSKKVLLLLILLYSCQRYSPIDSFNNDIIKVVENNSLYSDSVDWAIVNADFETINSDANYTTQCSSSISIILGELRKHGDNHSFCVSKEVIDRMTRQSKDEYQASAKLIDGNIGYIKIPRFASINDSISNEFAFKIQSLIREMDSDSIRGWIVDLRENAGGSLYPMLAGLGPLLGEGILGYFIDKNGEKTSLTYFKGEARENISSDKIIELENRIKSPMINNDVGYSYVKNYYTLKNRNSKIAVLISSKTSSSGEITAISFVGKPNVKTFGHASSGHTTANTAFMLLDSSYILLTTSNTADRNEVIYADGITPDVEITGYSSKEHILKAKAWFNEI